MELLTEKAPYFETFLTSFKKRGIRSFSMEN